MEDSKSGTKINDDLKTNKESVDVKILDSDAERDIQNAMVSDRTEVVNVRTPESTVLNQPGCSWRDPSLKHEPNQTLANPVAQPVDSDISDVAFNSKVVTCTSHNQVVQNVVRPFSENRNNHVAPTRRFPLLEPLDLGHNQTQVNRSGLPAMPNRPPNVGLPVQNFPNVGIIRSLNFRNMITDGPPPSYSKSLLDRRVNPCASIQFVAPIPPPSYDGTENEHRFTGLHAPTGFTLGLGNTWQFQPQPAYCPVCDTVIITRTDLRVSRTAHLIAILLFFILCWPFCLLPYFMAACNYTVHYCSLCQLYLGARTPFQRG